MKRMLLPLIILAALLVSCAPQTTSVPAIAVPPSQPTSGEVVVTVAPAIPEPTEAAPTPGAEETPSVVAVAPEQPGSPADLSAWIAYLADDGNLWLVNSGSGEMRQVTQDGTPMNNAGNGETVFYGAPEWSSDGRMLASVRQHGVPVETGMQYDFSLYIYDMETATARSLLEGPQQVAGFDWVPGADRIAFGQGVPGEYFATRGAPDPAYARPILTVDVETGETAELVPTVRGLTLVNPVFNPDGSKVAFEEVYLMEGRGKFAYYDLATELYTAWDTPIGLFNWTPDGLNLIYDSLTYAPSGTESIFWNTMYGDQEERLLPENAPNTYAYGPALSPDGSQIAFVQEQLLEGGITASQVMVMPATGGEPRALGVLDQPGDLQWSADEQTLLLGAGPWFNGRQVALINVADGAFRPLAGGTFASWQPQP